MNAQAIVLSTSALPRDCGTMDDISEEGTEGKLSGVGSYPRLVQHCLLSQVQYATLLCKTHKQIDSR
jgi:hypothetical protein